MILFTRHRGNQKLSSKENISKKAAQSPFAMAFAADMEPELGGISILLRLTVLLIEIYILFPNHRFSSPRLYKVRLYSLCLGIAFLYFGVEMIFDYHAGGKDFAMVPIAVFILYNAFALPASVWLRKRVAELAAAE